MPLRPHPYWLLSRAMSLRGTGTFGDTTRFNAEIQRWPKWEHFTSTPERHGSDQKMLPRLLFLLLVIVVADFGLIRLAAASCQSPGNRLPLERQLASIQRLEQKRQCASKSARGLFNPCRQLANKRAAVKRKLASSRDNQACSRPVANKRVERQPTRSAKARRPWPSALASAAALYCVRPSDGYFFPAPNSQFQKVQDIPNVVDQCRFICNDHSMELYHLASFELETENMVSADGRTYYRDLTGAFSYRSNADFTACNHKRYHERVAELRARKATPTDLANATIPIPTYRPDHQAPASAPAELATPSSVSYEQTSSVTATRVIDLIGTSAQ
jgi:hypothetical protein